MSQQESQPVCQSVSQQVSQPVSQPVSQLVNQPVPTKHCNLGRPLGAKKVLDIGVFTGASALAAALAIPEVNS